MPPRRQYGKKKAGSSSAAAKIFGSTIVHDNEPVPEPPSASTRSPLADVTLAVGNLNIESRDDTTISEPVVSKQSSKNERIEETAVNSTVATTGSNPVTICHTTRSPPKEASIKNEDISSFVVSNQMNESSSSEDEQDELYISDIQSSGGLFQSYHTLKIVLLKND